MKKRFLMIIMILLIISCSGCENKKLDLEKLYENNIVDYGSGPRPFQQLTENEFKIVYEIGTGEKIWKKEF